MYILNCTKPNVFLAVHKTHLKNLCNFSSKSEKEVWRWTQGGTICGLSSLASFLKILSSKRVCCVFRDIRDKNAVNQGFWSKTAVFSLPATKVHCFLIFWLPHLYNLLQPGIRKQQKYTSIHEYLYLAINKAKFALLLFQPSHCSRVILEYLRIPNNTKIQGWRIED